MKNANSPLGHLSAPLLSPRFPLAGLALGCATLLAGVTDSKAQLDPVACYATSDGGDNLFVQDPTTGLWSLVGPIGLTLNEAIAFNPYTQTLFATDDDSFGTLDVSTGTFTQIGVDLGTARNPTLGDIDIADIDGLSVDPITQLIWASERRGTAGVRDALFQIDPATGLVVQDAFGLGIDYVEIEEVTDPVTMAVYFDIDDIALDPTTGELYGVANSGGVGGTLAIINTTDGTIDVTVGNFTGVDDIEGLGFYNDGVLYGTTGQGGTALTRNRVYRIDKSTGASTDLGLIDPTGANTDFESVDCYTGAPNVITGTVFQDVDENGAIGSGEPGTESVTVFLIRDTDGDGIFTPGVDEQILQQETAADGTYQFDIASTGGFFVVIDPDDLPEGQSLTTDNLEVANFNNVGQRDDDNDFGHNQLGTIGNFVWFDEDSNGLQDDGEPGIANVLLKLCDDLGNVLATTVTDSNGGYLFTDLPAGNYFVDVVESSLPAGFTQSPLTNPNGDFGNQDQSISGPGDFGYPVTIGGTEPADNLTADFGYNVNPAIDVNDPSGSPTAALGDTIWIDSNGDGVKDPGEVGVEGVVVTLFSDPDGDGIYDTPAGTATTDETGFYIFDGLTPDAYVVEVTDSSSASHDILDGEVFAQTGDPDGTFDSQSEPVVLGPGDVYINADFGYQPNDGTLFGCIGDTVFLDLNADGINGADENGIGWVTVSLIKDTNANGVFDPGEPILATDVTDSNGNYLFKDLAFGDYIVFVNDTANVLDGLDQTFDDDGVAGTPNMSATTVSPGAENDFDQDFGYTPADPIGSIGDTIWADLDSSGGDQSTQGNEPGLEGVTVNLFADADGNGGADDINADGSIDANDVIDTIVTDANGNYLFDNLPLGGYVVVVDTTTLPAGVTATPTFESDGGSDSASAISLTVASPDNRAQDFSYPPDGTLGAIGDTIYADDDSDGTQNLGEQGIPGVAVDLFDLGPDGLPGGGDDVLIATTTTDIEGNYIFDQLPAGSYQIVVDSTTLPLGVANLPTGDPEGDLNNDSVINLAAGAQNLDQDFGYPPSDPGNPAGSIGDTIYADLDGNGTQDPDEPGIPGVRVTLTDSLGNTLVTNTDADGNYNFPGLDPDPSITYTVTVNTATIPPGFNLTPTESGSDGGTDNSSSTTLDITDATTRNDDTQDFGFAPATEFGTIGDFVFLDSDGGGDQNEIDTGIGGVIVELLDANGNVIATTTTGADGSYLFGGLPLDDSTGAPGADYTVQVSSENFAPGGALEGFDNTFDSDGNSDSIGSVVTLSSGNLTDSDQDFGYFSPDAGTIGTTVFEDTNADGDIDAGEDGIGGVTVALYRDADGDGFVDPGETLVGTTTTDADGEYLFTGLPFGDYIVVVTDEDGVLGGTSHSVGTPGLDNNSQEDSGYAVTIDAANPSDETADFGYFTDPASLGNFVFFDADGDGQQDAGEPGIEGVTVTLTITYPDGTVVGLTTTSDATGFYEFTNLLLDEDYNSGTGADNPVFVISAETPEFFEPTLIDQTTGGITDNDDSDDPAGVTARPVQGSQDVAQNASPNDEDTVASYDFGFVFTKAQTFADWQAQNPSAGGATDDPDMDGRTNLEEFALCLKTDSGLNGSSTGEPGSTYPGFCIESAAGLIDGTFLRPENVEGVTYTLEYAAELGMPTTYTGVILDGTNSTATPQGDGSSLVTINDIEAITGLASGTGFVRLSISLDSPAETVTTKPQGWLTHVINPECESFAFPFEDKQLYGGKGSVTGNSLTLDPSTLSTGDDIGAVLRATGSNYYVEVTGGDNVGHRFEIDEAASTANEIVLLTDGILCGGPDESTQVSVPATLADDTVVVRRYRTIDELFPPADYTAGGDPDTGANLLFFDPLAQSFTTFFLLDDGTGAPKWVVVGSTADQGSEIVPPGQGVFTHNKAPAAPFDLLEIGTVRCNPSVQPLKEGFNFVAATHPVATSPEDRGMVDTTFTGTTDPDTADQLLFWNGDAVPGDSGYDARFYLVHDDGTNPALDQWTDTDDVNLLDRNALDDFPADRSAIYDVSNANPTYTVPVPFN